MSQLKLRIKYTIEGVIHLLLRMFCLLPLRDQVVFSSFSGRQYSDSPRRISERLARVAPDLKQIWAFTEPDKYAWLSEKGIDVVRYKSLRYLFLVMTSRVYVDNVEFWSALRFRKGQTVIETWHGGGAYKRVGSDRLDVNELERRHVVRKMNGVTVFLSSSKAFTKYVLKGAYHYQGEILEIGLPRNDELIAPDVESANELRRKLGLPEGQKILLYAPTFRNSMSVEIYDVDFTSLKEALAARFGGEWVVLYRLHYYMKGNVLFDIEDGIDVSDYPDMQELLAVADVLLTDYSSTIWDFALTGRPCFLYAPDVSDYCSERNFYTPIESWPFPFAEDNASLIKNVSSFDEMSCRAAIDRHLSALGSMESGNATELVCLRILSALEEKA